MFNLDHQSWDWEVLTAALRATQLWKGVVTSTTPTAVYTVPTGKRAIIKTVRVLNAGGAARDFQLRITGPGTIWHVVLAAYGAGGDTSQLTSWIVLNAGEQILVDLTVAGTVTCVISGSEHTV